MNGHSGADVEVSFREVGLESWESKKDAVAMVQMRLEENLDQHTWTHRKMYTKLWGLVPRKR